MNEKLTLKAISYALDDAKRAVDDINESRNNLLKSHTSKNAYADLSNKHAEKALAKLANCIDWLEALQDKKEK